MSTNPVGGAHPADPIGDKIPRPVTIVLGVLMFTAFVMMLNETTLAVALPAIMADYAIPASTAQWLLTGFMLTMAVVLPATGWMLDRFATRAVFVFAAATFLVGTVTAALAPSFAVLLGARVAQAVGTAIVMPLLMTVAMTLVPAHRRGAVMGLIAVVMAVGPAVGPTVAGVVLSLTSWHGIFWCMVPLVAAAAVLGAMMLSDVGERRATPFDLLSVILSVFAFGGLIYGVSSVGVLVEGGEAARTALLVLLVGLVALGLFVRRQLVRSRTDRALLDLRTLGVRNFTISLIVLMSLMGALVGVMSTLPLYLQGSLMVSALISGLVLLPGGLIEGVLSPFFGRFFDRRGPRPLIVPGLVMVAGSLFWLVMVDEATRLWQVVIIHVIFSVGLAALFTPLMTTALGSLPRHLYGHGSAILNTLAQLAAAAGTAGMITVYGQGSSRAVAAGVQETAAVAAGARSAFLSAAVVALIALVLSVFITRAPQESGGSGHPDLVELDLSDRPGEGSDQHA